MTRERKRWFLCLFFFQLKNLCLFGTTNFDFGRETLFLLPRRVFLSFFFQTLCFILFLFFSSVLLGSQRLPPLLVIYISSFYFFFDFNVNKKCYLNKSGGLVLFLYCFLVCSIFRFYCCLHLLYGWSTLETVVIRREEIGFLLFSPFFTLIFVLLTVILKTKKVIKGSDNSGTMEEIFC